MSETETELPTVVYGILMRFQIANGPLMIPSAFFFFFFVIWFRVAFFFFKIIIEYFTWGLLLKQ